MKKKLTISDLDGFADICDESKYLVNGGYTESGTYCDGSTLKQDEEKDRADEGDKRDKDHNSGPSNSSSGGK